MGGRMVVVGAGIELRYSKDPEEGQIDACDDLAVQHCRRLFELLLWWIQISLDSRITLFY